METAKQETITQPEGSQLVTFAPHVAGVVILVILPAFLSSYIQSVMTRFLIFALFAMGYNLAFGSCPHIFKA